MNGTQLQILLDDNVDVDAERDESMALLCLVSGEKREEMELLLTIYMTCQVPVYDVTFQVMPVHSSLDY